MFLSRFLLLAGLVSLVRPSLTLAADPSGASVLVHIRAVRALERVEGSESRAARVNEIEPDSDILQVDNRIRDLADKLRKLNFRTFRLISSQREVVPIGRKQNVGLVDGNQLTLRPLTLDGGRVTMWIKWEDGSGMQILDTRMHFDCGESVITGLEEASDSGLILAIDVSPMKRNVPKAQPISDAP